MTAYIIIPIYSLAFAFWKFTRKTEWVSNAGMDLKTGLKAFDELDAHYQSISFIPRTRAEKFWDWVSGCCLNHLPFGFGLI